MQINPYLNFNGNCEEAFTFYERCLRGKIVAIHRFEGSPMAEHVPAGSNLIMHIRLEVKGQALLGSDATPDRYHKPTGMYVSLQIDEPGEAERLFHEMAEGGRVEMPIQKTFWATRFAMFEDRFGIPWLINCE